VNSVPHIGHAFEFILGDAISKWFKSIGDDVHFNVGLDEHGAKVWEKSQEIGIPTPEYIKNLTHTWKDFCDRFSIEYDSFYKTSDPDHHEKVKIIWSRFVDRGDIYKGFYKGKYCKGCESHKQDSDLVDGKCLDHPTTNIEIIEEENYFFKISKYRNSLLNWIEQNPNFLEPKSKLDELYNLIDNVGDISVSRSVQKCPWGISVPDDDSQIIYVWLEALLNYIFAAGYLTDNFNWNDVVQICGPDNLRFQAIIFQSFLESEGIKKTGKLLVHGTILDKNGLKISKSIGNVIDPIEQLDKYGLYPVRYYALGGLSTYSDSSWNEDDLKNIWNSEIVNDWGNLVSRVLHLVDIKCEGNLVNPQNDFVDLVLSYDKKVRESWNNFKVKDALRFTNELVKVGNKYINDNKPWSSTDYLSQLSNLDYLLNVVNSLYVPLFGKEKCDEIDLLIKGGKKQILFDRI
jgi:methionyl-tRNA synthetase